MVITGAAHGLGQALCHRFGAEGARIAALDQDREGLAGLETGLRGAGVEVLTVPCDVSVEAECIEAIEAVRRRFGGLDLLVNNAGISHRSRFTDTDPEVIRRVMAVNFEGAVHCTRAALPDLLERRGMVIAIASVAGFAPLVARTGYAASKHAMVGFFESLRAEVEPRGVRVLVVCPAFIRTGIGRNALGGDGKPLGREQVVVGGRSAPEQVARRIVSAAARGHRLLLPDPVARASWWLWRLAPGLYRRLMARRLEGELRP